NGWLLRCDIGFLASVHKLGVGDSISLAAFGALRIELTFALLNVALENRGTPHPLILGACLRCLPRRAGPSDQEAERCCLSKVHCSPRTVSPPHHAAQQ